MPRVIVFDRELHEPLTIVNLPMALFELGKAGQPIALEPQEDDVRIMSRTQPTQRRKRVVYLTLEPVVRHVRARPHLQAFGVRHETEDLFWFAYASNPETALLLRAAFLPGQLGEVRRREQVAWIKGALGVMED